MQSKYRVVETERSHADLAVAWADTPQEIGHYATTYAQDGPVEVQERKGRKWVTLFERRRLTPTKA